VIPTSSRALYAGETADPYLLALRAYVWGYAPVRAARLREAATNPVDPFIPRLPASAGAPLNNLGRQKRLSDATLAGVAPNVDTLYTLAWLDLEAEPFVLEAPDFGSRYYTVSDRLRRHRNGRFVRRAYARASTAADLRFWTG